MCALTLSAACLLFRDQIISPAGFSGKISQIAVDFLAIFALALAPNYIMILSTAIFRAGGEACLVLMAMAMIGLINIAMNFLLVFGLFSLTGFGYRGIALSTAGAMAAGTTICAALFRRSRRKGIFSGPWRTSADLVRRIVLLSWPTALIQVS